MASANTRVQDHRSHGHCMRRSMPWLRRLERGIRSGLRKRKSRLQGSTGKGFGKNSKIVVSEL